FFGGAAAVQVLDSLIVTLHIEPMKDPRIGLLMWGELRTVRDARTGMTYRLFANAELNTVGPFYRSQIWPEDPLFPNVGSFPPNTREARVLILLHELGHLIKGPNGTWLIPDDGGNAGLSKQNTRMIESKCGEEIRSL